MSTLAASAVLAAAFASLGTAIMNWRTARLLGHRREILDRWQSLLSERSHMLWEAELRQLDRESRDQ